MSMASGGQSGGSTGVPLGRVESELRGRESMLWSRVALKLVVGVPLTLLLPLIVAIVLWLWTWNYFFLWFILVCTAWAAVAYKLVRGNEGKSYFAESMIEQVGGDLEQWESGSFSYEEYAAQQHAAAARAVLEMVLTGPREVYEAVRLIQEQRRFSSEERRRAAELVQELSRRDAGVPWPGLKREGETLEQLLKVLGYLRFNEWIDLGKDGRKVWLLSDARRLLMGK